MFAVQYVRLLATKWLKMKVLVTDCAGYKTWEDSHDTHMVAIIQVNHSFIRTSHIPPAAIHAQIVFRRIVEML